MRCGKRRTTPEGVRRRRREEDRNDAGLMALTYRAPCETSKFTSSGLADSSVRCRTAMQQAGDGKSLSLSDVRHDERRLGEQQSRIRWCSMISRRRRRLPCRTLFAGPKSTTRLATQGLGRPPISRAGRSDATLDRCGSTDFRRALSKFPRRERATQRAGGCVLDIQAAA